MSAGFTGARDLTPNRKFNPPPPPIITRVSLPVNVIFTLFLLALINLKKKKKTTYTHIHTWGPPNTHRLRAPGP
jgi:hypothetical protein